MSAGVASVFAFMIQRRRKRRNGTSMGTNLDSHDDGSFPRGSVSAVSMEALTLNAANKITDVEIKERLGGGNFGDVYKGGCLFIGVCLFLTLLTYF